MITAERLFAERGLDGVSLRQIGVAAGNGNHSAVQYHFGSKDQLVRAIFEYRLPHLHERRRLLMERHQPDDLRSTLEAYVLPILEQGEQRGSHYLGFVAMLQQHGDPHLFDSSPAELRAATQQYREQLSALLISIPEPLRSHRLSEAIAISVLASARRERAMAAGLRVLPFAVHVADLLDGLVGFLEAPVSAAAAAALDATELTALGALLPI